MAAVTLLGTATWNTTSGTKTVTATPAVGDLIVLIVAHSGSTSTAAPTDNNAGGGGTYTLIESAPKNASADLMRAWVRDARITSATSTVFTHAPGTTTGGGIAVLKISGGTRAGLTAIRSSGLQSNQAAGGTPAPVLTASPLTTNAIITAVFNAANPANVTIPSGYTDRANLGYNTPATGLRVASDDSGVTSATVTWGGTSGSAFSAIAIEVSAATSHDTSGTPTGPGSTIAGTAAHVAIHTTTGALTGPGSTVAGSAARFRAFSTSGVLTGPGSEVVGSAARAGGIVTHDTTGALTGAGSLVSGSAARTREHTSTGVLSGPGTNVVGSAARTRAHPTSGVLTGPGTQVVGSAARTRAHDTSGTLTGPGSTVAGTAARTRQHPSTGTLTGPGSTVAGSAARTRAHDTSGTVSGPGAAVAGSAARTREHTSTGVLSGPGATVSGSAARAGAPQTHPTSGDLVGPGAVVTGDATHIPNHQTTGEIIGVGAAVTGEAVRFRVHDTSGVLTGPGAVITGAAAKLHTINLCLTEVQAQKLYEIWLLHGLGPVPLVVQPTARTAGVLSQSVTDNAGEVVIETVTGGSPVDIDVGQLVDDLAALHGLDGTSLTVTAATRTAGAINQTITTAGTTITVERQ